MDDRVPECRDSHTSSSHEPSLEPVRSADLGKHSTQCLYSLHKKPKLPDLPEDQNHKGEDVLAESYLVQKILVIWLQPITKFSVKVVNLETIIDLQSWCRTWPPNGSSRIRAKQKLPRKHKGACKISWSQIGSLKSFTLTVPWNLAKIVKIFPGIIVRQRHTDQKQIWIAERAVRRVKEGTSAVLLHSGLENGGQIPWNVIPICDTFKISCLMGKLHTRDVLGNHLKDRSFRLVHWLSITLFLRKTSQESINLERKFCLDCSLDTLCMRWEFGRVT